jgi:serine/threonine protein kinase/tetratricopeptide (TPR) repeat protein
VQADRWQQVKQIYQSLCEVEPEQRGAFLDQQCTSDAELRREVESLLAAGDAVPAFLDTPAVAAFGDLLTLERPESFVGQRVGPYVLSRLIASGGMGTVFLGVRADEQFEQRVAIKFVRRGLASADCLRRFFRERQTLASLEHPNIARLLDGGATADGLPYFVMEYVEGKPIDEYCDEHCLNTARRLDLFATVCGAVRYAHQNLVVHRDLKPSNIFVTPDGAPKLLDFGIAKVLTPDPQSDRGVPTATLQPCMTPEYASPEQIRGEPITTATDVYSLGVVLYELLTGHHPYRARSRLLHELARTICEDEPMRPSTMVRRVEETSTDVDGVPEVLTPELVSRRRGVQPDKLRRRLSGDIDAIVLMALRKEPKRRYVSVEQFSEDIRRHLEGLPVQARHSTFGYRSARFIRRHKAGVVAASVVVLSLLGGIAATTWAAGVASRERDAAVRARQFAQQEAANARVEAHKSERVTSFLQNMLAAASPGRDGPDVTVGALLDEAAARVSTEFGDDPEVESAVRTAIGETYIELGRYADAEPHLRTALAIQRRIHGEEHWDVAKSLNSLGVLLYAKGDYAEAQSCLEQALAMHRKTYGNEHPDVAQDLNNLAVVLRVQGNDAAAEPMLRQALAIRRRLYGDENRETAETLNNLANLLRSREEYAQAEPLCREVLAVRRKLLGEKHPDVAQAINNLAVVLAAQGENAEADALLRQSITLDRELLGPDHPELAGTLYNLGTLLLRSNDAAGAEPLFRECFAIRARRLPEGDPRTASTKQGLGNCLTALGRYAEAEPLVVEAYHTLDGSLGPQHVRTVSALHAVIALYEKWDHPDEAARFRALLPPPSPASEPSAR